MKLFASAFVFLLAQSTIAATPLKTIDEVAVMQQRDDGDYDVICSNGNREIATDLDISLNNVCPNKTSSEPTKILSLQKRSDGDFDVVCRDHSKTVVSTAEIVAGTACNEFLPSVTIEDGYYVPQSYWCPQELTAHHNEEGILESLTVAYVGGCSSSGEYLCQGHICTESSGWNYILTILTPTTYEFSDASGNDKTLFTKQ